MKKGFYTLEYVIAAVLIIVFAGIVIYVFTPRIQKAPSFVEGFLPEKCQATGLTRDQYLSKISAELMAPNPNFKNALKLRTEMQACFPDTDIHEDLKQYIVEQGILKMDFEKLDDGKAESLRKALDLYVDSKGLLSPEDFKTIALLLFSRAIYHFKESPAEGIKLLDVILKRNNIADEQLAEAMARKALFLERQDKTQQALELYNKIIDKFGKSKNPDVQLYVGIALLNTGQASESIQLLRSARKAKSPYGYEMVDFYYLNALYATQAPGESMGYAESLLDALFTSPKFEHSVAYNDLFDAYFQIYAKIPAAQRNLKDCPLDSLLTNKCICQKPFPAILPDKDRNYCCSPGISEQECWCRANKRLACRAYETEQMCISDPCRFSQDPSLRGPYGASCQWAESKCYMQIWAPVKWE